MLFKQSSKQYYKLNVLLLCVFGFILGLSGSALAYDKTEKAAYYSSEAFQAEVPKYCSYNTAFVATAKQEISNKEEGKFIISKLADFASKSQWNGEIIESKSFAFPGIKTSGQGALYHFEGKGSALSPGSKNSYDYYIKSLTPTSIKTCTVFSTLPLKKADFEYKIIEADGKFYLQRKARMLPNLKLPQSLLLKKLESANKDSLRKTIKGVLALRASK
jgi:hypothetical protein